MQGLGILQVSTRLEHSANPQYGYWREVVLGLGQCVFTTGTTFDVSNGIPLGPGQDSPAPPRRWLVSASTNSGFTGSWLARHQAFNVGFFAVRTPIACIAGVSAFRFAMALKTPLT
ncbi:unnamed protein product, partial [Symbiodinium sp. KB8]